MGDPSLPTPLAQVEAPFVWLAVTAFPVVFSLLALLALITDRDARRTWRDRIGPLPWVTSGFGLMTFAILYVAFWLFAALSYWVCRGGHLFEHRVFPAITYYVALALFALWSLPVAFGYRRVGTGILVLTCAGFIVYTAAAFASGTTWAGALAVGAVLSLMGITVSWLYSE